MTHVFPKCILLLQNFYFSVLKLTVKLTVKIGQGTRNNPGKGEVEILELVLTLQK